MGVDNCCPVCYKASGDGDGEGGKGRTTWKSKGFERKRRKAVQERFFNLFQRYLEDGGDQQKGSGDGGHGSDSDSPIKELIFPLDKLLELGMNACGECLEVMESFCAVYQELERLQLEMNWKVSALKNIMEEAQAQGPSSPRLDYFRKCVEKLEVGGGQGGKGTRIIESVIKSKELLIEKCSRKLNNAVSKPLMDTFPSRPGAPPITGVMTWLTLPKYDEEDSEINYDYSATHSANTGLAGAGSTHLEESQSWAKFESELEIPLDAEVKQEPPDSPAEEVFPMSEEEISVAPPKPRRSSHKRKQNKDQVEAVPSTNKKRAKRNSESLPNKRGHQNDHDSHRGQVEAGPSSYEPRPADYAAAAIMNDPIMDLVNLPYHHPDKDDHRDEDFEPDPRDLPGVASSETDGNRREYHSCFRLRCPDCQGPFRDIQAILLHRKSSESCKASYDPTTYVRVEVLIPPKSMEDPDDSMDDSNFTDVLAIINLPQEIYHCDVCHLAVYSLEDLEIHRKLHDSYSCDRCNKFQCSYAPEFAKHLLFKHGTKKGIKRMSETGIRCPYQGCDFKSGGSKSTIRDVYVPHYLSKHLNLILHLSHCAICRVDRNGMRRSKLANHFRTQHDLSKIKPEEVLHCSFPNCHAYFMGEGQRKYHLSKCHGQEDSSGGNSDELIFKCWDCARSYAVWESFRLHRLKSHVDPDKVIPCRFENCPKVFETERDVERHMQHSASYHESLADPESNIVLCSQCGKACVGSVGLKSHLRTHEGNGAAGSGGSTGPFVCELCGKIYQSKSSLGKHYSICHADPEKMRFECEVCSRRFYQQYKLDNHMMSHSNESRNKPFVCELCGKAYLHRAGLNHHLSQAHGDLYPHHLNKAPPKRKENNDDANPMSQESSMEEEQEEGIAGQNSQQILGIAHHHHPSLSEFFK